MVEPKNIGEKIYVPTLVEGMLRVNFGDEPEVNIKLISNDGICIIGQEDDCEISKSTRDGSSLYKIVEIDETDLKIRYSGHGTRLEKFTILPENDGESIPEGNWNVDIVKDKQISRFYYKITYTPIN